MSQYIVNVNGLVFGTKPFYLTPALQGISKPQIRTTGDDFSGADGGYIGGQNYSRRTIVLNGFVEGGTQFVQDRIDEMNAGLPIRQTLPVFVTSYTGVTRYTEAVLTDIKSDIEIENQRMFQITLLCPDAYFYDAGDGVDPNSGWLEQSIYKTVGGGFILPVITPIVTSPGTTPATITNSGAVTISPQIVLKDRFTNPKITNKRTGQFIKINVTTAPGDTVTIDMKNRTIVLNGGSIAAYRSSDSSWWTLPPGDSMVTLESDSGADNTTGKIRWRAAYEGF